MIKIIRIFFFAIIIAMIIPTATAPSEDTTSSFPEIFPQIFPDEYSKNFFLSYSQDIAWEKRRAETRKKINECIIISSLADDRLLPPPCKKYDFDVNGVVDVLDFNYYNFKVAARFR